MRIAEKEKEYEYAKTVMLGKKGIRRALNRFVGRCLAFITWRINRFGSKAHNDKAYNKKYFQLHQLEIRSIEKFLTDDYSKETYKKCIQYRISHKVSEQPDYNKKNQYFVPNIIQLKADEVFVDCGAYTGDTIRDFIKYSKNKYKSIIAFEPSKKNARRMEIADERISVISKGVWDNNEVLLFKEDGEGSSITSVTGEQEADKIVCCRLDDCECCKEATYIKMDIEGAELKALIGAEKIISKNHPKLAICIYHSAEDMVQIPLYLNRKYPFYKFYVRHHSHRCAETVLYCIP